MDIERLPIITKRPRDKVRLARELAAQANELSSGRWHNQTVMHVSITKDIMERIDDVTMGETNPEDVNLNENPMPPIYDSIQIHFTADKEEDGRTVYLLESSVDQTIEPTDIPLYLLKDMLNEAREDSNHALWATLNEIGGAEDVSSLDPADMLYTSPISRMQNARYIISDSGRIDDYVIQHTYIINDEIAKNNAYRLSDRVASVHERYSIGDDEEDTSKYNPSTPGFSPLTVSTIENMKDVDLQLKAFLDEQNTHELVNASEFPQKIHIRRALGILALLRGESEREDKKQTISREPSALSVLFSHL